MKNLPNQSLMGIMRHVDVKPRESNLRISVVDQRDQLTRLETSLQSSRGKENPSSPIVQNSQIRIATPAMRNTHSGSFCSSLLGSTVMPSSSMERHNIRVNTHSHNKLVDRLLRKDSRFLSQLTDWLEQPLEKSEDEGAISLDDGVQDMLEAVMCDFVVEMCRGGCKTTQLRRSVLTNQPSSTACAVDQHDCKTMDGENEKLAQSAHSLTAPTIPDAVYHSENHLGIDVPRILLAVHHIPNPDQQPRRRVPSDWHKQRIISTKKALRSDSALGGSVEGPSAVFIANDYSRSPTTSVTNGNINPCTDGSSKIERENDF